MVAESSKRSTGDNFWGEAFFKAGYLYPNPSTNPEGIRRTNND